MIPTSRRRRQLLLVAIASTSVVALLLYSLTIGPESVAIGDLNDGHVGMAVMIVGIVGEARLLSAGLAMQVFDPLDMSEVSVFIPRSVYDNLGPTSIPELGDEVAVRGEVQLYRGELEILVTEPSGVQILRRQTEVTWLSAS